MTITNKQAHHPPLSFNNTQLQEVKEHKHLGLTLTHNLSWTVHIDSIVQSASKMCDVLKKFKYELDRKSLETIYFSFIRPKLEYGSIVWDDCTEQEKLTLEQVQLSAARIVTGAKKGTSHHLIHEELHWPTLQDRRTNMKLKNMHKMMYGKAPEYLCELLPNLVRENQRYPLRNNNNFRQIYTRTEGFRQSILPHSVKLWNNLDETSKSIPDFDAFSCHISDELLINPLYYFGSRKANIIHAQMRMNCSDLRAHLLQLHVVDDPICLCQTGREDTRHFFFTCPLYIRQRITLHNIVSTSSKWTLDTLLFGDRDLDLESNKLLFQAVHDFITDSGRFT